MKRRLAILLIFWLPLFMQSAWAMGTRMAVQDAQTSISLQANLDVASESMHCHGSVDKRSEVQTDNQPSRHNHHCAHCLACVIVTSSASFNTVPQFHVPDLIQEISSSTPALYLSIHLPAAIKPPISA